jgi:hypothetical protein
LATVDARQRLVAIGSWGDGGLSSAPVASTSARDALCGLASRQSNGNDDEFNEVARRSSQDYRDLGHQRLIRATHCWLRQRTPEEFVRDLIKIAAIARLRGITPGVRSLAIHDLPFAEGVVEEVNQTISDIIDKKVGEVRLESLDFSFGELLTLKQNNELVIDPEYQRLFRWSPEKQSRLIESVLLGLPIPQLFVVENPDGTLELIDGLQRLSSVIHFLQPEPGIVGEAVPDEPARDEHGNLLGLVLSGCDIVPELNGMRSDDLPLSLRLKLKRSPARLTIIKKQSLHTLRYEMFKRLNTGGAALSQQEVRNCTARLIGETGIRFYSFLKDLCNNPDFLETTSSLSDADKEQKGDEELVLRFFALKNGQARFKGSISDWLTDYMEAVTLNNEEFDYEAERQVFDRLFHVLNAALGEKAFVRFKDDRPIGALAPAYFEGITMGVLRHLDKAEALAPQDLARALTDARQHPDFIANVGPGANSKGKLEGRIRAVAQWLPA